MEKYDIDRAKNAKLSDLDKETLEKSNYLLTKAQAQLEEQEDDIKHLNELMLYAKCVTIRDNQVEQKVCYYHTNQVQHLILLLNFSPTRN
jgi:predicted nucleotidyltransferase